MLACGGAGTPDVASSVAAACVLCGQTVPSPGAINIIWLLASTSVPAQASTNQAKLY